MAKVSIVKGNNRKENIKGAIKTIWKDIEIAIKKKNSKQLFIKINAIDSNFSLACTHIEAIEAVLDIFYSRFNKIIIGDNTFVFTKNKGGVYRKLLEKYPNVKLSDLGEFESEKIEFKQLNGRIGIGKISLLPKKAFTISLALPKTHDEFIYTGCLKNMFGCVIQGRGYLHAIRIRERIIINKKIKSNKLQWENLLEVINKSKADLYVLDAFEGMEGDGPIFGNKIKIGLALCSLDGIALDKIASKIFGFYPVPYLSMLHSAEPEIIKFGFNNIEEINKKFKLHYNYKYQKMDKDTSILPMIDLKFIFSIIKRSYRIKDKLLARIKGS